MLTCAMCGKPMRDACDIYHVAKNKQGRECVICGDCAEELEAYAERLRKSAHEICKGQKGPEQKESASAVPPAGSGR